MSTKNILDKDYKEWISEVKSKIRSTQLKAAVAVNVELIKFYWYLAQMLFEKQTAWGSNFLETVSKDLKREFTDMQGFSLTNLKYCRAYYQFFSNRPHLGDELQNEKSPHPGDELFYAAKELSFQVPWGHIKEIISKTENVEQLVTHIRKFLLELGKGFAFVGQQFQITIAENDYYIDLLFYHIKLKCYVVIELKNTTFIPEYAGKLNFYLSAVDSILKGSDDKPTIGLILCRDKNNVEAEFALRGINKPMGVTEFQLTDQLPENLKSSLPTVEELERNLKNK